MRGARTLGALVLALGLLAAGCRGGGEATTAEQTTAAAEETTAAAGGESEQEATAAASEGIATDVGVTEEPCPDAVNADNGCIYLGTLSDLSQGPFAALGGAITEAQAAFWRTVNEEGGIGGAYDVNVSEYVRDNLYNPETHNALYQEIKPNVLALAQTLGSPTTAAIVEDMAANNVVGAPASWTSAWAYQDVILESGNNYCVESMNGVDYLLDEEGVQAESVMAIHYVGDYGDDGAAGTRIVAEARGLEFIDVETPVGSENQAGAIDRLVTEAPDIAVITTNPADMATIVGQAAAQGFTGRVIGNGPTWNPGVVQSPAVDAVESLYLQAGPWETYSSDTPGHEAMRTALGTEEGNDGFTSGWAWSYPLLAALEQAYENGDLTRQGVVDAVGDLGQVDYQGMLPEGAGNLGAEPNEGLIVRATVISRVDRASSTGVATASDGFYTGPTAQAHQFDGPCYE
jgi:ABC-type branched-subunit amino acid transport system substrate-binding protein